jgi:single-strand DNA-binding protein
MNKVILMGRLTNDPDVRYAQGDEPKAIASYNLAVDRRGKDAGTDFISIVAFDKNGEFAEKYLHKGTKILVTGRIRTGSYTNKDGNKVYTTDVIAEEQEFCESKKAEESAPAAKGFENINFEISNDEELPFGNPTR